MGNITWQTLYKILIFLHEQFSHLAWEALHPAGKIPSNTSGLQEESSLQKKHFSDKQFWHVAFLPLNAQPLSFI